MNYITAARKAIESQYDAKCDIIEYGNVLVGNITKNQEKIKEHDVPCKISFEDIYSNTETDTENKIVQKVKLFIKPELIINPGSKIVVVRKNRIIPYKNSGEPAVYDTHQEIILEPWKGWT